jgi:hypothetical protein
MQIGLETIEASFDETASSRIEEHLVGKDRNRAMQLNPIKSCEVTSSQQLKLSSVCTGLNPATMQ